MSMLFPLAMIGRARAEALNGERGVARAAYGDALRFWRDADTSLAPLQAAGRESAALQ